MPFPASRARLPSLLAAAALLLACPSCSDPTVTDASAHLEAEPAVLDFGLVFVGDRVAREVELRSDGRLPVTLSAMGGPEGFLIEPAAVELEAGGTARVRVIFAPAVEGDAAGKLTLGGEDARVGVRVRGAGVARQLEAQAELDFGAVWLGRSADGAVRVVNRSALPVTLEAAVDGDGAHAFHPAPGPLEVPAGGTADARVTFAPEQRGGAHGTLLLSPCSTCEPLRVSLDGEGLLDRVIATPSFLDFGAVSVGGSRSLGLSLRNEGDVARTVAYFRAVPDPGGEFTAGADALPVDLAPGDAASFEAAFAPVDAGLRAVSLQALDEEGELVVEVPLAGVGQSLTITADPASLDFGPQPVGRSRTLEATFAVAGGSLQVTGVAIEGSATTFRPTPGRPLPAAVGDPLAVSVTFVPPTTGDHRAVLVLATDDPGRPELRVPLSGTGTVEGPCLVDVRPAELRFGLVSAGSIQRGVITVSNTGTGQCRLAGAKIDAPPGNFALEPVEETIELEPGQARELVVVYAPPAGVYQTDRGTLRFTTNDITRSLVLVTLSGTAFAGDLRALPDPVDFGDVILGSLAFRTVELRNAGAAAVTLTGLSWAPGASPAFQLRNPPALPVRLAPGAGVTVGLAMTATSVSATPHEAVLEVAVEGVSATKRVPVRGRVVSGECGPECHTPTALCPGSVVTEVTKEVRLNGTGLDPDGDALTCAWSLVAAPVGSHAAATPFLPCGTAFRPDVVGDYRFELVLTDPAGNQDRCVTPVRADPYTGLWLETYWDVDADVDLHLLHPTHHPGIDPFDAWSWAGTDGADCFYWSCRAGVATLSWPDSTGPEDDPSLDVDSQHLGPENIRVDVPNRTHPYWIGVHWLYNPQGQASVHVTTNVYCGGLLAASGTATLLHRQHAVLGKVDVNPDGTCAFTPNGTVFSY